nr:AAA family ATPase [Candidatus Woesearchaeota archaeon]
MIIGVTGNYGSGKDTAAEILEKMSFEHISFSDILREELKKEKKAITRENLINIGNKLRKENGPTILAKLALGKINPTNNYVFTSIRNPSEVSLLQERSDFIMVNVTASEEVRLSRIVARNRENDPKTLKELQKKEKRENSKDKNAQQLNAVAKLAKIVIKNESSLDELKQKVQRMIQDFEGKLSYHRPPWDEYFVDITKQVGTRATCGRGRSGCVIVKDNHILVTGYVGSPKGLPHCDEVGHEFKKVLKEDGSTSNHCVRGAHAEQNAICQAAKLGIPLEGSTLYCRMTPCYVCAKLIVNCGIIRVVAINDYHASQESKRIFKESGLKLSVVNKETVKY